ncbi:FtsX-like permease family protein [Caloranaerobacter sp. DY30410]|uniref:ABC transporter permease n=1 Tax=Caloranaerobacter sp. DY30410 TaxID=3238305 RepID=UPI003D0752B7
MNFAFKSIWKEKGRSLLMILLISISVFLILRVVTTSFAFKIQQKMIKSMFKTNMNRIYRLDFSSIPPGEEGEKINNIKEFAMRYENVSVSAYDETTLYFKELKNNKEYRERNATILKGTILEDYPGISDVVMIEPNMLNYINFSLEENDFKPILIDGEEYLPLFVGSKYSDIIKVNTILTIEHNNAKYIVKGYLGDNDIWFNDSDPITDTPIKLSTKFFAPFSASDKTDNMTQLSTVGKIFINLGENKNYLKILEEIEEFALNENVKMRISNLAEFMELWEKSQKNIAKFGYILAFTITFCSLVSVIASLCVSVFLRKKEFGIRIAYGYSKKDIICSVIFENLILVGISTIVVYMYYFLKVQAMKFTTVNVLLVTLKSYSLWIITIFALLVLIIISILPIKLISEYQPVDLIDGGE